MSGILFIHGGGSLAKEWLDRGAASWNQALPLVLEKHGLLDVTSCGPEGLHDEELWRRHAIVLIARLPADALTDGVLERAGRLGKPVLIDGPAPTLAQDAVGVRAVGVLADPTQIACTDSRVTAAGARFGAPAGGELGTPRSVGISSNPSHPWLEIPSVPIRMSQARAWSGRLENALRWEPVADSEVLAELHDARTGSVHPAIVRRGAIVACAFDLFGWLVQRHTAPPASATSYDEYGPSLGVELLLMGIIDDMYRQAAEQRVRVGPWPSGVRWARTIVHDFERPAHVDFVRSLIHAHNQAHSAVTWFWRAKPRHQGRRPPADHRELTAAGLVADEPRHEVALLAELLWTGAAGELEIIEAATGRRVRGFATHTGRGESFGWQGAPNVLWAERQGIEYTELRGSPHAHPHRIPLVAADGSIEPSRVMGLPRRLPFDQKGNGAGVLDELPAWIALGAGVQVAVPADEAGAGFFECLQRMPSDGRADWTAAQVADWWRRTHTDELRMTSLHGGGVELVSRQPVQDLVVELRSPDGEARTAVVSLQPGTAVRVTPDGAVMLTE